MTYVNCYKEDCTHFCGRKSSLHKAKGNPVDLSILGNPFVLTREEDRETNLRQYTEYLYEYCNENPYIIEILRAIPDDAKLGCFCHPKKCHCCIIIDASTYYKHNEKHNVIHTN